MKSEIYKQILNKVESAQEILITAHENPDGDAVASVCAIAEWLKSLNKNYYIYFQDYPEKCFYFLANIEKIETDKEKIPFSKIDLAIVLDCASLRRSKKK